MPRENFGPPVDASAAYDVSKLKGKSVVITGGASGFGEGFARALVRVGAFVTIGDLAEERGKQLVAELGTNNAIFSRCDVLDWSSQVALFKKAINNSPNRSVDIVIANAGIIDPKSDWRDDVDANGDPVESPANILRVNLFGTFNTAKLAHHYFARQPTNGDHDRCLLMISSMGCYFDLPGQPQYGAAKWAARGLMRSFRASTQDTGVRVNLIAPWYARTGMVSQEQFDDLESKGITFCEVEDAATAVLHLSSDKSINGRAIAIVPRKQTERGYIDLDRDPDDLDEIITV